MPALARHCNMVLEGVKEMWTELPKTGKGGRGGVEVLEVGVGGVCWRRR